MQSAHGRDRYGAKVVSAFRATSFEIGRGPAGEQVLPLAIGQSGAISLLMPGPMPGQLSEQRQKLAH